MKTIYHPTTGSAREVPEADVDKWAAVGWRKTKPKAAKDAKDASDS